ncbi:DUF2271 domain-containing protein [Coralloluteibacterium stylophorae]|uniref:FAD:protein FMN transferase n=1 Tax=Coralloluteibacterium stylophorae TaxID=1776034 RepID=A0AAP2CGF9_9GAMM|nr:DUF2271 domain-containing protein [Coralloluteibacterium stylophorae]
MTALALLAVTSAAQATVARDGVLGTSFAIEVRGAAEAPAERAALAEIARLEALLSTWRADSELSAYNAGRIARDALSADTLAVLEACERWREATRDAFSCRVGPLVERWRAAEAEGAMPDRGALRRQARAIDAAPWPAEGALEAGGALRFDVDGIAKGYILDRALAAARAAVPGATGIRIEIGGDLAHWGSDGEGRGWAAGVADPLHPLDNAAPRVVLRLEGRALAASGHASRGYTVGRRRLSHIVDPRDGQALRYAPAAVVVAPDAATADALATALTVLPIRSGLELVDGIDGVAALVVGDAGVPFASARWPALVDAGAETSVPEHARVEVDYAIPQFDADGYRRPYLALWIERADGAPVRQLHVLGDRARWLAELPQWWRQYGRDDPVAPLALARPTRAPGRYALAWDGRDDLGRAVADGRYVLRVEAAREHGGHDVVAVPFDLGGADAAWHQPARGEIGDIDIRHAAP